METAFSILTCSTSIITTTLVIVNDNKTLSPKTHQRCGLQTTSEEPLGVAVIKGPLVK